MQLESLFERSQVTVPKHKSITKENVLGQEKRKYEGIEAKT